MYVVTVGNNPKPTRLIFKCSAYHAWLTTLQGRHSIVEVGKATYTSCKSLSDLIIACRTMTRANNDTFISNTLNHARRCELRGNGY